jgi:hypothetical protein
MKKGGMQMKTRFLVIVVCLVTIALICPYNALAQGVTLVDFGSSAGTTTFGLSGWNTILKSGNLSYTSLGNGGVVATTDPGEFGDYRGVQGTPRDFSVGERIVVTWYNNSSESVFFTARISFTDSNEPNEAASDGNWYTMRSFDDYRITYSEIQPQSTARTVFNITDSGVHKTDGNYSLVNINLSIEWYSTYQKPFLICDKIELFNDADITPPARVTGLTASALSDSKIQLNWNQPTDDVGTVEYLIYVDGAIEGYSRSSSHTCVFLEPGTEYTFYVTALDAAGNESSPSDAASTSTLSWGEGDGLINPAGFEYLGSIAVSEDYNWGGEAIAYYRDGDGGQSGSTDGYPGSLFVTNVNQPENGLVGEVSIPPPVISPQRNIGDLSQAVTITSPVNIRPANVNSWAYVDIWRTGLEYLPVQGRLYSSWSIHYTVTGEKHASVSCCDASDLAGSTKYGAWYIGDAGEPPIDAMMNDWLFAVPQSWADANCLGRNLVVGRCRDGGLSGLGPTLYGFSKVGTTPPAANAELDFTTLLEYGSVEGTDNYNFPHSIDGYNHSDDWREAMWLTAGHQNAVAVVGNKALGHNWYGYNGEWMHHDWVIVDLPYPEFWETDPDGKGWRSHNRQPMILFYDPDDLAAVAGGAMESYEPQPYAALRIDRDLFFGPYHEIFSAAFDTDNSILYVTEFVRDPDGRLILHAWRVNPVSTSVRSEERTPETFALGQNYPNPFNPETTIEYHLPRSAEVILTIYDLKGNTINRIDQGMQSAGTHAIQWNGRTDTKNLVSSGTYFYRIEARSHEETYIKAGKMVFLK